MPEGRPAEVPDEDRDDVPDVDRTLAGRRFVAVEAQDRWLADLLAASPTLTLHGGTLRIDAGRHGLLLVEDDEPHAWTPGRTLRA